MARLPRIQFPGALYHIFNQGNYQQDLFPTAADASSFVSCLEATCKKMGWIVHAYGLLKNHYHLAIETPTESLMEGAHWLQGTYANRLNRSRGQKGHLFQGRYKAILVEPGQYFSNLVSYIHLKPVTTNLISIDQLPQFRWSSFRSFSSADRPNFLSCSKWLHTPGFTETPRDWQIYFSHLKSIAVDEKKQKERAFASMSSGWIHGSSNFKKLMMEKMQSLPSSRNKNIRNLREFSELRWSHLLKNGRSHLKQTTPINPFERKSALWKLLIATWMHQQTNAPNQWLAENLHMGTPGTVSAYVGLFVRSGGTKTKLFRDLSQKLNKLNIET